jgi:hypothetical protein
MVSVKNPWSLRKKKQKWANRTFACTPSQTSSSYPGVEVHYPEWEDLLDRGELCATGFLHTEQLGL